jgi:hypothetical protein
MSSSPLGQSCFGQIIKLEVSFTCEDQKRGQSRPSTVDVAFDGAHCHIAHRSGFLVAQALCPDSQQCLPLACGGRRQSGTKVLEVEMALLVGMRLQPRGIGSVSILSLILALAVLGVEEIAQDRKQPCVEVGAALEFIDVG